MNSSPYIALVQLQSAASSLAQSFEVGIVQQTPFPNLTPSISSKLEQLCIEAFNLSRAPDQIDEFSHAFCAPELTVVVGQHGGTIRMGVAKSVASVNRLARIRGEIDGLVAQCYGLSTDDNQRLLLTLDTQTIVDDLSLESLADDDSDEIAVDGHAAGDSTLGLLQSVENLFQWCLGCVAGRWDVRFARYSTLLPRLQGPFEALPRCSPGMLVGIDGLPAIPNGIVSEEWLLARPNVISLPPEGSVRQPTIPESEYPLRIAWDGIIPDDESHADDMVRRVRSVLELLWADRAESIEQEACEILDVPSLREYFRQPKQFLDYHIKRYSKSRRKAPIYWLLQSAKKNYGLWLYYHRIDQDTLFKALTQYAEPKISLEKIGLDDLRGQLSPDLAARERRALERSVAKQEALLEELTDFRNELERLARLQLTPDFNDGVLIGMAPLHTLVPWKEAEKMWDELVDGKYPWSSMSQRMRERGLVKNLGS